MVYYFITTISGYLYAINYGNAGALLRHLGYRYHDRNTLIYNLLSVTQLLGTPLPTVASLINH